MSFRRLQPGCPCCETGCVLQDTDFDTADDLKNYFDAPTSGVEHHLASGTVIVSADDIVILGTATHPTSPYSGKLNIRVLIADGKKARFFVAADDEDNCVVVEIEPYTSTNTPCQQEFGWVRFFKRTAGVDAAVGHEQLRLGIVADEWLSVSVWWDADTTNGKAARVSIQVDREGAYYALGVMTTQWFATWPTDGDKAGFGTGTADDNNTVNFDDYIFTAKGTIQPDYYGPEEECGTVPYNCEIVPAEEMFFGDDSMPCSWDGTPGADWNEYSGTHRTVIADENVRVRAVFAFGEMDGEGDSTTVGLTGGSNTLTATLTETAPLGALRQFSCVWKFNGVTKRTQLNLPIEQTGGVELIACPTVFVLYNGGYLAGSVYNPYDLVGTLPDDPLGVTITQGALGGSKLTSFEVWHHPKGLPTTAECQGCGTCRDLCDPPFDEDELFIDLGPAFLTEQNVFLPWWDTSSDMCADVADIVAGDVQTNTCQFRYSVGYGGGGFPLDSLIIEAKFSDFVTTFRWEVTITLSRNRNHSGLYYNTIATYRLDVADCATPEDGYWELDLVSVTNFTGVLRCSGTWPSTIKIAFDEAAL